MEKIHQTFTITENHLKLLRRARVRWDNCEYGAPGIDPKRPYRNSSVLTDIAEIVNPEFKQMREGAALDWLDDNTDRLERLHRETETVLRIGLAVGRFEVGRYVLASGDYTWQGQWRPVESREV